MERKRKKEERKKGGKTKFKTILRLFIEEIYIILGIRSNARNAALVQTSWSGL